MKTDQLGMRCVQYVIWFSTRRKYRIRCCIYRIDMVCANYTTTTTTMFRISPSVSSLNGNCMDNQHHTQAPCELHGVFPLLNQSSYLESYHEVTTFY